MHNGKGTNGRSRDRFASARNQKKYRVREKRKIQFEKNMLIRMTEVLMEKNGIEGAAEEFLKFMMIHLVADWLTAHWKPDTRKERENPLSH